MIINANKENNSMKSSEFPLVKNEIKIAMIGMVEGNGHPYSWSAIFNGYDASLMMDCPYPAIPAYLNKQPNDTFGIEQAKVTHIWTENEDESRQIAKATFIPNVVTNPKDVIGKSDAVIMPTDKGFEHVERCRPFIEAGIPIFIDKPLVDNEKDLSTFKRWEKNGASIMSSSSMRYSKEF